MAIRTGLRRWLGRIVPDLGADPRGVTVLEILIAMTILVVALVALYGLVSNAIRSFNVGEDFLDVQQNAGHDADSDGNLRKVMGLPADK